MQADPFKLDSIKPISNFDEVKALLRLCDLPVSDIGGARASRFFGIHHGSKLVAVVGTELYGPVGLLRSLAVMPLYRSHGLARQLVAHAENVAASAGAASLFLLTTTAAGYFEKLDYVRFPREQAPSAIQATAQFSGICPSSSVMLCKSLPKKGVSI